jgi:hypothetical protein
MEKNVTKKRTRRKLKRRPRNLIEQDGLNWISQAGYLWGDYKTCAEYIGIAPSSFAQYVWRHGLRTIKYGRRSLVSKKELDRVTGALAIN